MAVSRDWVGQVKAVLSQAKKIEEQPPVTAELQALRAYQLYEFNTAQVVVDPSPRARALREVNRIAAWYGWVSEVARALDSEAASTLAGLSDAGLDQLVARMRLLEECVQTGGDAPDAPPAR